MPLLGAPAAPLRSGSGRALNSLRCACGAPLRGHLLCLCPCLGRWRQSPFIFGGLFGALRLALALRASPALSWGFARHLFTLALLFHSPPPLPRERSAEFRESFGTYEAGSVSSFLTETKCFTSLGWFDIRPCLCLSNISKTGILYNCQTVLKGGFAFFPFPPAWTLALNCKLYKKSSAVSASFWQSFFCSRTKC